LTPAQQEQLSSLGLYLQSVRQEQGRTVDEVATQIFIRPALLQAVEAGNGDTLPEPVFIQGFIRRYGDALGLDGSEIAKQFEPTAVSVLPDPLAAQAGMDGVVSKQEQHKLKVLSQVESRPGNNSALPWGILGGGLVLLAIAGGGLWALLGSGGDRPRLNLAQQDGETLSEVNEATADPTTEPEESAAEEPEPATTTAEPTAPVTVAVSLTGDSWLQVTADGEQVYEGILRTGTQETWTAQNELTIATGNAGAVQLSYNGADQAPMGEPGGIERVSFTADESSADATP
jgi:cytoskeletal protein RodZ